MTDATGVAEAMLGLPGFRVLDVEEGDGEVVILIETVDELVGCAGCGVIARRTAGWRWTTAIWPPSDGPRGFSGESAGGAVRSRSAR